MLDNLILNKLQNNFNACTKLLAAIGSETRQSIIVALIGAGCGGLRVGEIAEQTHLSRPSVSHHVRILMEVGVMKVYKIVTKHFYYMDLSSGLLDICSSIGFCGFENGIGLTGEM